MFSQLSALAEKAAPFVEDAIAEAVSGKTNASDTTSERALENAKPMSAISEDATRKALFVGINYFGTQAELRGCINDVQNISEWLFTKGFSRDNARILTDDADDESNQPTKANILAGMRWLVEGAQSGDSLFFHYSGHGGTAKDTSGDEVDCQDETICPVDYQDAGQILDDEMHQIMVKSLPAGCHLTCIYDSCHSGSALDLPFTYTIDGNLQITCRNNTKAILKCGMEAGMNWAKGNKAAAMASLKEGFSLFQQGGLSGDQEQQQEAMEKMQREKGTDADVVQLSGCRDEQTSADACIEGQHTGALSHAFIETVNENADLTYTQLLEGLRGILHGKYSQIPQMSTGHMTDMNSSVAL